MKESTYEKIYMYFTRSAFLIVGTLMIVTLLDNQYYNYIISNVKAAQGMAVILYLLLSTILFSVGITYFIIKIIDRKKPNLREEKQ